MDYTLIDADSHVRLWLYVVRNDSSEETLYALVYQSEEDKSTRLSALVLPSARRSTKKDGPNAMVQISFPLEPLGHGQSVPLKLYSFFPISVSTVFPQSSAICLCPYLRGHRDFCRLWLEPHTGNWIFL